MRRFSIVKLALGVMAVSFLGADVTASATVPGCNGRILFTQAVGDGTLNHGPVHSVGPHPTRSR